LISYYLITGLGGGLGAITRVALIKIIPSTLVNNSFPIKILAINIMGCFIMGYIAEWMEIFEKGSQGTLQNFLISGFLGGFTTFSAFSLEFWLLINRNMISTAISYALISYIATLGAFFLGYKLAKLLTYIS